VGLPGVLGTTVGDDPGVGGSSSAGPGVWGHAAPGPGVKGTSNNGTAVYGVTGSPSGFTQIAGVVGDSNVRAIPGVAGLSSNGVGLLGRGAAAPLRLVPSSSTGPPTGTGFDGGEIVLDAAGSLFVCLDALHWNRVAYGSGFFAMNPTRVCDTRPNTGPGGSVANNPLNVYAGDTMSPFGDLTVFVAGPIGPGAQQTVVPATATAVVLNLAVVNFSAPGNFTVYPADLANPPTAANLNWPGPQADGLAALSNSVTVRIGNPSGDSARRAVRIHNASSGATDVVVDLAGYYL
jgi:hypothetical protein